MGVFSGLESFGFGKLKNLEIFEKEKEADASSEAEKEKAKPQVKEADILFEKSYTCPVCDAEFKAKTVRTGKVKLMSADTDLRPKYQLVDAIKYDAIVCPSCGYAALNRFFTYMTNGQAKLIRENITSNFRGIDDKNDIYTYEDAIARHKLALLNAVVKKGKTSERAYICLKLAWLYRGMAEDLPKETENYDKKIAALKNEEDDMIGKAYEGFKDAFAKEQFPMCGMDESTATYLVADLARRSGNFDDANLWLSKVLTSRMANERLKSKAREVKELIHEARK